MMSKLKDGIIGLCLGDALGVPVEFKSRGQIAKMPVTDMIGYGTYNLPPGSWSDDSTMTFCTIESLTECSGIDLDHMMNKFSRWLFDGYWTPYGEVFDIGNATRQAIIRAKQQYIRPELAGGSTLQSNGNGSLMRILPAAYWIRQAAFEERVSAVESVSSLTHRHPISIIACVFYVEFAIMLLNGHSPADCLAGTRKIIHKLYADHPDIGPFHRLLSVDLEQLEEGGIQSSGYVVHTLEASIWCLLTTGSYKEAVLKAVNLGEDTDTTGAVTGGLAGIYYGLNDIPHHWIKQLARLEDINILCDRFERALTAR